jgi:hypothetical protein
MGRPRSTARWQVIVVLLIVLEIVLALIRH